MVKNEEFYSRAQRARDYYKEEKLYSYAYIVKKIVGEVFDNGDEFPEKLIFYGHHYSINMVEDVLTTLELNYEKLTRFGDCFIIYKLTLK